MPAVGERDAAGAMAAYVAWVQIQHGHGANTETEAALWQRLCWQVTAHMEAFGAGDMQSGALLALGWCAATEAAGVAHGLVGRLAAAGFRARVGIGPNATLAQLALQCGEATSKLKGQAVVVVTPGETTERLLARTPVGVLAQLHPRGVVTAETVERLQRYGLRTLGQVARLVERSGEVALRRQFGPVVGGALVALARGEELRPLQPTMQPETLRCRVRWVMGGSATQVGVGLGRLAERIAGTLAEREQAAGSLRLRVTWTSGGISEQETRLRERVGGSGQEGRRLAEALRGLWEQMRDQGTEQTGDGEQVAEVGEIVVEVGDLAAVRPAQGAFWKTSVQQNTALSALRARVRARFGVGAQRTGMGSGVGLGQISCVAPEAVFAEERYVVEGAGDEQMSGAAGCSARNRWRGQRAEDGGALGTDGGAGDGDLWAEAPHRLHWW